MNIYKAALAAFQMVLDRFGYLAELAMLFAAGAIMCGLFIGCAIIVIVRAKQGG